MQQGGFEDDQLRLIAMQGLGAIERGLRLREGGGGGTAHGALVTGHQQVALHEGFRHPGVASCDLARRFQRPQGGLECFHGLLMRMLDVGSLAALDVNLGLQQQAIRLLLG